MWSGRGEKLKENLKMVVIGFLISCSVIVLTTPLHEAGHWIMSDIDPYVKPVEFHIFDGAYSQKEKNALFSPLGYVAVTESYPGSFRDRPLWADTLQEIICFSIQIIIACFVVSKSLDRLFLENRSSRLH